MINRVVLVGRLTRDIELRKTNSNLSYCRFTVACDRRGSQQANSNAPTADFISCTAWRQSAEFLAQYASKGAIVAVDGHITTGSYDGPNGKVYTTDVTADSVRLISSSRNGGTEAPRPSVSNQTFTPSNESAYSMDDGSSGSSPLDISSDDLPFY